MRRRILLVYPRFARNNLLNYEYSASFYLGKHAVMPPLGLLLIGAKLRQDHDVRMVDENVRALTPDDLAWGDVVALSAMHPQRSRVNEIVAEARRLGKITILGGPSVNICPEYYPDVDILHVGEIGDATESLLEFLRSRSGKPESQIIFKTSAVTPLDAQPLPARDLVAVNGYIVQPIQFSVGCPFTCEFCDIPMIYGRIARLKSGSRLVQELEQIYQLGFVGTVLFVDDNLIANRKALKAMLPEVIRWQAAHGFPYPLTGEASINLARDREILKLMQDARFTHLFVGVESTEEETLRSISKRQNVMSPMIDSLRTLESYGLEPVLGMILGFDTDTVDSASSATRFVEESHVPTVYYNLLAALPKTPLWARLEGEGRLLTDSAGDHTQSESLLSCMTTNIEFSLPNDVVKAMLRQTVRDVYSSQSVYRRFLWIIENVHPRQLKGRPPSRTRTQQWFLVKFSAVTLMRILYRAGVKAPSRREFWLFLQDLFRLKRRGVISSVLEELLLVVPNAYHLITWAGVLLSDKDGAQAELRAAGFLTHSTHQQYG
jgi:hopanoid C-2 methylase